MKLTFLGTGGGRHVVISQLRATGGFIVEGKNLRMLVDPGPGALVRAREFKKDLKKMNAIFVSHAHPDHYTDLEMAIEAMTLGAHKKRGILIGSESVIFGTSDKRTIVSKYHLDIVEKYFALKADEVVEVSGESLKATKCNHSEEKCIGFVMTDENGEKLGYTSDGVYYEGQEKYFEGCSCLIINCLRPRNTPNYGHMTADNAKTLVEKARPNMAILQHLGMKMLFGVAEREAKWIENETGIKTIAATDGMIIEFSNKESKVVQSTLK
jgi:phosphoribosyl 1,2-cyclic phosphodiesterase